VTTAHATPPSPDSTPEWPQRVLLVGSSGGHLAQLLVLEPWWSKRERVWVTFATPDAQSQLIREDVVWAHFPTTRNLRNLIRNLWLAFRTIPRVRPDIVVSTGAAVAVPFFIAARLRRIPTVYVEVYDRIDTPTLTGRLCRPLTTLFCVQWEEQLSLYRGAQLIGELL
jgi:UDP-N-acetylglucosamine:LPS N-acetylglucosamine transferase